MDVQIKVIYGDPTKKADTELEGRSIDKTSYLERISGNNADIRSTGT